MAQIERVSYRTGFVARLGEAALLPAIEGGERVAWFEDHGGTRTGAVQSLNEASGTTRTSSPSMSSTSSTERGRLA
jgi:hypothetical protein